MNIIFLLRYWPIYGGGETVTITLANKLADLGYGVSVMYLWEKKRENMPFIDERIQQYPVNGVSSPRGKGKYAIAQSDFNALRKDLNEYIKNNSIDIIINQWWPTGIVHKARINTSAKLICCHHLNVIQVPLIKTLKQKTLYFFLRKQYAAVRRYIHKRRLYDSFKYADKWVMLCKAFIEECKELFQIVNDDGRICAIPNPLPYNEFFEIEKLPDKKKELLFVGRISEPHKRISYIIKLWDTLTATGEFADWKLTIVGDGPDLEQSKQYAKNLHCQRIYFEGHQNPLEYYRRGAVFLMTSALEGWGMTLVEAQQNGCVPVVMDTFASLHEIVQHGDNGIIVKNDDMPGYINALQKLMSDDEYRRRLALKGLETCRQFSVENVIQQWEVLFREIVPSR